MSATTRALYGIPHNHKLCARASGARPGPEEGENPCN